MAIKLSPDSVRKAASGIDRMMGNMSYETQQSIRSVFFLTVFALVVGGSIYGYMKGKNAAVIKSTPIIEFTNDVFDLDLKRERGEGNFSSMPDSDMINELKGKDVNKTQYPSRVSLEPEVDRGIIEPDINKRIRPQADVQIKEPIIEEENRFKPRIDSSVTPIERKAVPGYGERETIIEREKKEIKPVRSKRTGLGDRPVEKSERKTDVIKRERRKDILAPEPPDKEGIIEN
jgi:hypothetical protein